jgi:hypothetical protein
MEKAINAKHMSRCRRCVPGARCCVLPRGKTHRSVSRPMRRSRLPSRKGESLELLILRHERAAAAAACCRAKQPITTHGPTT